MSFEKKLVDYILQKEGGLSRQPADNAAANPAPYTHNGYNDWHTNMGITWKAFESNASKLGYQVNYQNFFFMPHSIWYKILKEVYMQGYPLERIDHLPRIKAVIITWAWGSGLGGSEKRLADYQREVMGIVDSNITRPEIVENFRKHINGMNERAYFDSLCNRRLEDFKKMNDWPVFGNGWSKSLERFRKLFA